MTHLKEIIEAELGTESPIVLSEELGRKISTYFMKDRTGNGLWESTPYVPDLDEKILSQIQQTPEKFSMVAWHLTASGRPLYTFSNFDLPLTRECGTSHCLAGWACVFAGKKGLELEKILGTAGAAALIFAKSTGHIPDFWTTEEKALRDLEQRVIGKI